MESLPQDGVTSYHAIYIDWVHAVQTTLTPRGEKHLDMSGLNLVEQNNTHHGQFNGQFSTASNLQQLLLQQQLTLATRDNKHQHLKWSLKFCSFFTKDSIKAQMMYHNEM